MLYDYGVYPAPKTDVLRSSAIRFEDGEFVTSLTQAIHPPVTGPMVLNVFAHDAGLEVGSLFDDSAPSISVNMSEYTDEPSDLSVQQIPPAPVGNDIGKVARIRRVSASKESPNGLASTTRSSPRSLASVPPHFLDITQAKSFGKLFLQILPLSTQYTLLPGTNFASILQAPSFCHTRGGLDRKSPSFSQRFFRVEEVDLGVSFNDQSQVPVIPGIS